MLQGKLCSLQMLRNCSRRRRQTSQLTIPCVRTMIRLARTGTRRMEKWSLLYNLVLRHYGRWERQRVRMNYISRASQLTASVWMFPSDYSSRRESCFEHRSPLPWRYLGTIPVYLGERSRFSGHHRLNVDERNWWRQRTQQERTRTCQRGTCAMFLYKNSDVWCLRSCRCD